MGPREEIARAFVRARGADLLASDEHWPDVVKQYREMVAKYPDFRNVHSLYTDAFRDADTALIRLRELGYITDTCLTAIHAEEDAAGEPRSTIERFKTK